MVWTTSNLLRSSLSTDRRIESVFRFPAAAAVGKVLNKERFYAGVRNNRKLKRLFTGEVTRVRWAYKLAPTTINLATADAVPEIEVIEIQATTEQVDDAVLRAIDRAIPNPTIHELHVGGRVRQMAAYKRTSESDIKAWVIGNYLRSDWQSVDDDRDPLPGAVNLDTLYASLLRSMVDVAPRGGENLRQHIERYEQIMALRKEATVVAAKMHRENQMNRRTEWNARLRAINGKIQELG